jgi:glycosyltransferase involved in cell wall biosynthesis
MRICLIGDGRSNHNHRWAKYFIDKGHEVHLITYDKSDDEPTSGAIEHILPSVLGNIYLSFIPRQFAINRLIAQIKPDIVHAQFITKFGFHLMLNGFKPSIMSAWGDDILILPKQSKIIHYLTKKAILSADLVYAVSHDIENHIIKDFGIPRERVKYLPFGVDTDVFAPPTIRLYDKQTIDVYCNRGYFPVYDIPTLIRAFALAHSKNKQLRLVLKKYGPEEDNIRELVASLKLDDVITVGKNTPHNDIYKDYQTYDIFATTSVSDGTPVSLLEAMSAGLPCVATRVGGIPEWIRHDVNGKLVPPGNVPKLAIELSRLARDPVLRHALGKAARETIISKGNHIVLMKTAEDDYSKLVDQYEIKG